MNILITGSSRGLGLSLAKFFITQGHQLIITAREPQALETARQQLAILGTVSAVAGDIQDAAHREALLEEAASLGGLDVLINNASSLGISPLPRLASYPLEGLAELYQSNVIAQLGLIQTAIPQLSQSHGLIINVSSDAARGGYEGWGAYGSSKAALDLISSTLANELKPQGISVVSVDPGDMRTEMHQQAFPGEDISNRPLPEATLPFWAWLLGQPASEVSGQRFAAQSERWEIAV